MNIKPKLSDKDIKRILKKWQHENKKESKQ